MQIKELFEQAIEQDSVDLQALIMFLTFEKQVVSMEDKLDALDIYLLAKHKDRMNKELKAYKKKMNMKYTPNVYKVTVNKRYKAIYILAHSQTQAESFSRYMLYEPLEVSICDDDLLMTRYNRKNEGINIQIKDLKENKIPCFLGGF